MIGSQQIRRIQPALHTLAEHHAVNWNKVISPCKRGLILTKIELLEKAINDLALEWMGEEAEGVVAELMEPRNVRFPSNDEQE